MRSHYSATVSEQCMQTVWASDKVIKKPLNIMRWLAAAGIRPLAIAPVFSGCQLGEFARRLEYLDRLSDGIHRVWFLREARFGALEIVNLC